MLFSIRNRYWETYKMFRDPPGTPKDLRCIGCKLAAGGGAVTIGLASGYGAAKTMMKNGFIGTLLGAGAVVCFGLSGIAFRMAMTDSEYNEKLLAETTEKIKQERRANRENLHNKTT